MNSTVPMISALTLRGMPEFIHSEISARALRVAYDQTGLPVGVMDIEDAYIPETALAGFIESAARSVGDQHFGLQLIPHLSVASYGTWGKYVLEAATLGESLARFERVIDLHASYHNWAVSIEGDLVWIRYQFQIEKDESYTNLAFCGVGVLANIIRHYAGPHWQPEAVEFDIDQPRRHFKIDNSFPCEQRFNTDGIGVAFQRNLLEAHRPNGPKEAAVSLADVHRSRTSHLPTTLSGAVSEIIRVQILRGEVNMDTAACLLDMGTRRLRRGMDREGTSFREVTRTIRTDLAKELIAGTSLSISAISTNLGYANTALFTRAFSRDVGINPSTYRRQNAHL
jgi:AraC-like DNA-binding protein